MRIPTTRLADRAVMRILALSKRFQPQETANLGKAIDQGLAQQAAPMAAPEGMEDAIITKALGL